MVTHIMTAGRGELVKQTRRRKRGRWREGEKRKRTLKNSTPLHSFYNKENTKKNRKRGKTHNF